MDQNLIARRGLLVGGAALLAGGQAWGQTAPPASTPLTVSVSDHVVEFLDSWVDAYGRPTAKVRINNSGPFNFMVDTGANSTVLTQRVVNAIGTPVLGTVLVHGTTGSMEVPFVTLDKLSTGVATIKDLRVAVLPDVQLPRVDGILGADVFVGRRLTFDILNKRVRVASSMRRRLSRAQVALTVRNGSLAEISGWAGGVKARMMLDTGAEICLINPVLANQIRKENPGLRMVQQVYVRGVTGHRMVGDLLELPLINMGGYVLRDGIAVVVEAPVFKVWGLENDPVLIVGVNVLSRLASFSIDYGGRHFEATPLAAGIPTDTGTMIS